MFVSGPGAIAGIAILFGELANGGSSGMKPGYCGISVSAPGRGASFSRTRCNGQRSWRRRSFSSKVPGAALNTRRDSYSTVTDLARFLG